MPNWDPQEIKILAVGEKIMVRCAANAHVHADAWENASASGNSQGYVQGTEISGEVSSVSKTYTIPPSIHAAPSITGAPTLTESVYSEASVTITGTETADPDTGTQTVEASGQIQLFGGTTGVTGPPTSGLTLVELNCEPMSPGYGYLMVRAVVFDWSNFETYAVTPSAGSDGSISPSSVQTVPSGSSLPFTATPAGGYTVNQWLVNGTPVAGATGNTFVLRGITAAATVEVTFH
jgi:hypothetical protein